MLNVANLVWGHKIGSNSTLRSSEYSLQSPQVPHGWPPHWTQKLRLLGMYHNVWQLRGDSMQDYICKHTVKVLEKKFQTSKEQTCGAEWNCMHSRLLIPCSEHWCLPACMSMYHMYACCPQRPEQGLRSPGIGVGDSCELPCACWELNLGPLGKQLMLLTAEPYTHCLKYICNCNRNPHRCLSMFSKCISKLCLLRCSRAWSPHHTNTHEHLTQFLNTIFQWTEMVLLRKMVDSRTGTREF